MTQQERWSTQTLASRIDSQLFERTAICIKPEVLIATDLQTLRGEGKVSKALLLKDVLDFLELNDAYLESDAIVRELQQCIWELGTGFSFIARHDDDYAIDLLFYNRKLRRLVSLSAAQIAVKPNEFATFDIRSKFARAILFASSPSS